MQTAPLVPRKSIRRRINYDLAQLFKTDDEIAQWLELKRSIAEHIGAIHRDIANEEQEDSDQKNFERATIFRARPRYIRVKDYRR